MKNISVVASIINACKEVKLMRAGKIPEPSLEDFFAKMEAVVSEEKAKLNANNTDKAIQLGH